MMGGSPPTTSLSRPGAAARRSPGARRLRPMDGAERHCSAAVSGGRRKGRRRQVRPQTGRARRRARPPPIPGRPAMSTTSTRTPGPDHVRGARRLARRTGPITGNRRSNIPCCTIELGPLRVRHTFVYPGERGPLCNCLRVFLPPGLDDAGRIPRCWFRDRYLLRCKGSHKCPACRIGAVGAGSDMLGGLKA